MRTSAPPLLGIFRSQLQGDLLARVLLDPGEMTISELARALGSPVATVQREVTRLEDMGLLTTHRVGRARVVAANHANPATGPLRDLVTIAFGPRQVIAEEFAGLAGADKVIIFGSWAARHSGEPGSTPGDVDVLVVGNPDRDDVFDAAERAQARLGRPVNTTVVSSKRWATADEPFLKDVQRRPAIAVAGATSA
jgi:DNA-binding transcriptional ArsR family regulator